MRYSVIAEAHHHGAAAASTNALLRLPARRYERLNEITAEILRRAVPEHAQPPTDLAA